MKLNTRLMLCFISKYSELRRMKIIKGILQQSLSAAASIMGRGGRNNITAFSLLMALSSQPHRLHRRILLGLVGEILIGQSVMVSDILLCSVIAYGNNGLYNEGPP